MTEFPTVEFDRREFGFVCLGRIFPEKRYEQAIEILDQVRRRGHPVSLRIAGGLDNPVYERFLRQKVEPHKDWVTLEGKLSKQPKARLVAGMKFGISTRPLEPFGIAVAEMVRAGCIVFAPRGGGQAEIIGDDRLLFTSQADAIEKICRVLEDEGLQQVLRRLLAERAKEFSTERFQAGFRTTVQSMLNGTNGADL